MGEKQPVQVIAVNYEPGKRKIAFVRTTKNHVFSVEQVRDMIDKGISVVTFDYNSGIIATVTKRDETGIQSVRDDTKENNLDKLEEFDL
jgi:hypothetical protein